MSRLGDPSYQEEWESPKHRYYSGVTTYIRELEKGTWFNKGACVGYVKEQREGSTVIAIKIGSETYPSTEEWIGSIRVDVLRRPVWRVV